MAQARSNWPELIVDAVEDRLSVEGLRFRLDAASEPSPLPWELWQRNGLDADQGLVTTSALTVGSAYVSVRPDGDWPTIRPEHAGECIVAYQPGDRRRRIAALKRWTPDGRATFAELYLPDRVYRLRNDGGGWIETTSVGNGAGVIPIIELANNPTLRPSMWGGGVGEFARHTDIVDRINTTVFARLLAQAYASFPVRVILGEPIRRGEDGKPIPPVNRVAVDHLWQFTNPDAKVVQLPESDLGNYLRAAESDIRHLAAITRTPPHYLLGEMVNLSADAIRAAEAALVAKVRRRQRQLGEAWEDVIRTALALSDNPDARALASDASAEVVWADPETRSIAERADAALKLHQVGFPFGYTARLMGASPQQIEQIQTERAADAITGAITPPPPPAAG